MSDTEAPAAALLPLFPKLLPYDTFALGVGDGHTLYAEQSGSPDGVPCVFLHGGPGAGASRAHGRFFDPARCRILLHDQRGVGKSTPSASTDAGLHANTTWHLADDVARLLDHLDIARAVISGGSWGSTLALAFATRHPERVRALVLRGVITFRQRELDWYFRDGASRLFPDAHAAFLSAVEAEAQDDPVAGYAPILLGGHTERRDLAVGAWQRWSAALGGLSPRRELLDAQPSPAAGIHALVSSRLECVYSRERAFMREDDALLRAAPSLAHLPLRIVQGRYDLTCPAETAVALHRAWPGSQLRLTHAGHSMFEPETASELVRAHAWAIEQP